MTNQTNNPIINAPGTDHMRPFMYHAIMDCFNCTASLITDAATIKTWADSLATSICATDTNDTNIVLTAATNPINVGYTATRILDTGAIIANFLNSQGHIYLDIVNTEYFDPAKVEALIQQYFGSNISINKILIPRNASAPLPPPAPPQ